MRRRSSATAAASSWPRRKWALARSPAAMSRPPRSVVSGVVCGHKSRGSFGFVAQLGVDDVEIGDGAARLAGTERGAGVRQSCDDLVALARHQRQEQVVERQRAIEARPAAR